MKTVPLPFTGLRPETNLERRADYSARLAANLATYQSWPIVPFNFGGLHARILTGTFIKVELKRGGPSKTARWLYDHAQAEQRYQATRGGAA